MQIVRKTHRVNAESHDIPNNNYIANRIGFWGLVKAQNSMNNTVTVVSDTGYEYGNLPVISDEWVTIDDDKDYVPSTRNLPPVNSRVFVLTPTFTASGAFVLCSGFSRGDENIRSLWASSESEVEDKNNCRETITQGGWDVTEEYANGNYKAVSNDGKITLVANTTENSQKGQNKEVSVEAWENKIVINADGITVTDKNNNKINFTSNGLSVEDKNGNKIEGTSGGIKITDKNSNIINMTSTDVQIMADTTKKLKVGNATDTIGGLLSDLLTKLNSGTVATAGSATAQTVTSGQFTNVITKLEAILE